MEIGDSFHGPDRSTEPAAAESVAEPVIDPAVPICDSHHHLRVRDLFPYSAEELVEDLRSGHDVVSTVYVECGQGYRPEGPPHLRPVGEVEYVLSQNLPPGVAGAIVAYADLRLGAAVDEVLEAHRAVAGPRVRGIRFMTAWDAALDNHDRTAGMLADPAVRRGIEVLGRHGLPLDCWMYHHQLGDLVDVARALPEQVFVLDHLGSPLLAGLGPADREAARARWREAVVALADRPNVLLKIGGLAMRLHGVPWTPEERPDSATLAAYWRADVARFLDAFGAERCMAESNFPIERHLVDYRTMWNALKRLVAGGSEDERAAVLGGTATRTYGLGSVGPSPDGDDAVGSEPDHYSRFTGHISPPIVNPLAR